MPPLQVNTQENSPENSNELIFFFDGVCGLCDRTVDFILLHDRKLLFLFSAIQNDETKSFFLRRGLPVPDLTTSILFDRGLFFYKSQAFFRIMSKLGFPWSLACIFQVIPSVISDFVYDRIAQNRYRIFGQRKTCRIPTAEERSRFLYG